MSNYPSTPLMRSIAAAVAANVPVLIWGKPGSGKTAKISAWLDKWNFHCEVLVGGNREATDFIGHPYIDDNDTTAYTDLEWSRRLRESGHGALILDELTTAAPSTQKGMLRVIQERMVGHHSLGENTVIVAMANPPEQGCDAYDLPAPTANRFMHVDWALDSKEWMAGLAQGFDHLEVPDLDTLVAPNTAAGQARAFQMVQGFLSHAGQFLEPDVPKDAHDAGRAWASPRMWTQAMKVIARIHATDDNTRFLALKGCVGDAAAKAFETWLMHADLADPEAVLADPSIVDWSNERPDRLWALTQSVMRIVQDPASQNPKTLWTQGMAVMAACCEAGKPDIVFTSVTKLYAANPDPKAPVPATILAMMEKLLINMNQLSGPLAAAS